MDSFSSRPSFQYTMPLEGTQDITVNNYRHTFLINRLTNITNNPKIYTK